MSITARLGVYALALAVLCGAGIARATAAHPNWSFDGYTYAIRMQMDAGVPYAQARTAARQFYSDKPPASDPETAPYLRTPYPQYWTLFAPRVLYPCAASLLWRLQGMRALLTVSNLAFVAGVLLLFGALARFAAPEVAALLAAAFALVPAVQLLGRSSLTDMTALALWIAALWAMCEYARGGGRRTFAAYALAAACMSFTRPIPYIPLCAGSALMFYGWRMKDVTALRRGAGIAAVAFVLCLAVAAVAARAGAPGLMTILHDARHGSRVLVHAPFAVWYAARVVSVLLHTALMLLELVVPAVGAYFLWRRRTDPVPAACLGALASLALTAAVDPILGDAARVMVVPVLPVFCIATALGLGARDAASRCANADANAA